MFKKILVPVDGSECSFRAAKAAAGLAQKFDSEITLMYVINMPITMTTGYGGELVIPQPVREQLKKEGDDIIMVAGAIFLGTDFRTIIKDGHPAGEILNEADNGYDLIVMGSRGLGEIKGFLLGSVSDRVMHHAGCAVLIIK